jgi:hypothetical protein
VVTLTKPKLIGCVSSDSGSIALVDPCHLSVSGTGSVRLPAWNLYTSVDTEVGDGEFTVYEQRDRKGRLRRIVIELE